MRHCGARLETTRAVPVQKTARARLVNATGPGGRRPRWWAAPQALFSKWAFSRRWAAEAGGDQAARWVRRRWPAVHGTAAESRRRCFQCRSRRHVGHVGFASQK